MSSLWAQPGSHLSLYLQSLYTQQATTEHLGTGLAVSPGRLKQVALLSKARSAPESQGRGTLLSICPSGLRGPRHTPPRSILGVPEEGQTGRAGLSSAQGQTGTPSDTDSELRSGPCSASRCWALGTDSGSVAAGWALAGSSFNPFGPRAPHLYDGATWEAMRRCGDERSAGRGLCPLFGDIITVWRLLRSAGTDA